MKLAPAQTFEIQDAGQKQFHRIVLLNTGTVVGYYSQDDACFLEWFTGNEILETKVDEITCDVFETPAFFHFQNYAGLYSSKNDFIILYNESDKNNPTRISITNHLPKTKYPNFDRPLSNYHSAGNTDTNIIPILFTNAGMLPVYVASLQVDVEKRTARWLDLRYWNNKQPIALENESFHKPQKPFTILHALNKQNVTLLYGIGDRDGGYLKPGMEFSELSAVDEKGAVKETLFSLGRLYKESKKGGKECTFSSSGKYAILTPAFKTDDWKNKQKLFALDGKELIELELPKALSDYRVIDHNNEMFLLANQHPNLVFAGTDSIILCRAQ
ncbi:hypothetical protein J2T02_003250 [Chitinophaga terrae (ex Kim and Jung 2007)]|uniref:hypothetical protein n=1 Tax=Chitinophaga terrae (ex Kim and Jung 2007) TaxID=408074 RepID=UPI0027857A60|nr:hypothetical protein [Chitinophaga terrae (ex Kim and Jung 2007)]MDQ0108128.1 hypothetical protein [Chitinophaga terrae (ex Kim and Jung 2007)]